MKADSRAGAAESDKLDDPGARRFLEAARKAGAEETEKGADRVKPRIAEMKARSTHKRSGAIQGGVFLSTLTARGWWTVDRTGTAPVCSLDPRYI